MSPEDPCSTGADASRTSPLRAWKLVGLLLLAVALSGCGGCQPGAVPENEDAGSKKPAAPGAAGAIATKPPIGAPGGLPPARDLPTMAPQKPAEPGAEPNAAADDAEPEDEPEEADCSVIADADPDFGEPPLAVQFSVDYECTESGAVVSWDFGDGSTTAGEENPSHTYREGGEYVAVVTVTTPDGATATDEIDITAEAEDEAPPDVEPENP